MEKIIAKLKAFLKKIIQLFATADLDKAKFLLEKAQEHARKVVQKETQKMDKALDRQVAAHAAANQAHLQYVATCTEALPVVKQAEELIDNLKKAVE